MTPEQQTELYHAVLCDHNTGAIHPVGVGGLEPDVQVASRSAMDAAAHPLNPPHMVPGVVRFVQIPVPVGLQYAGDGPGVSLEHVLAGMTQGEQPDPQEVVTQADEGMNPNHVAALFAWLMGALGHPPPFAQSEEEPEMAAPPNGNGAGDPRMMMDADQMMEAMAAQMAAQGLAQQPQGG